MKHLIPWILLLTFGSAAFSADRPPNVVILLADDLGYGELGCQGNPQIATPHIDSLATNGVRFTDGYVTAAYCSASRAGLMTGRYQTRFGYEFNPIGAHNDDPRVGLPGSERTLARHLHDAGYATALIGKWHLGGSAAFHPHRRGFDEFFGFLHEGHYFVPPPYAGVTTMLRRRALPFGGKGRFTRSDGKMIYSTHMGYDEPAYDANNPILRGGQPVVEERYLTEALTREAVGFIERHRRQPFFLYLAYNAVHSPLQATDAKMKRFADIDDVHRRIFAGMLSSLDDSVGEVLAALDNTGLEKDTLVVFLSDNGGPTRELTSSNKPLRGEKGDLYEGGIRIPFLMQWRGTIPEGKVESRPVISLDLFATCAAVANQPLPMNKTFDGVNLLPYLTGKNASRPHATLFWRAQKKAAARMGDWKLVRNPRRGTEAEWELFDLAKDIGESRNLADREPKKLAELKAAWKQLDEQMQPPFWRPPRRR